MSYLAIVSTGVYPIPVPEVEVVISSFNFEFSDNFAEDFRLNADFDEVRIPDADLASSFLRTYASLRNLVVSEDLRPHYDFALINPRHDSIRNVRINDNGMNLLDFIEPRYIKLLEV